MPVKWISCIGETYQTDVCQQLQFHDYRQLLHRFARLCKAGSLACGGFEVPVTQTSASAFQQDDFLFVLGDVADIFTRFGVVHHRAAGHFNHLVRSVFSETAVFGTGFSVTCQDVAIVLQME